MIAAATAIMDIACVTSALRK